MPITRRYVYFISYSFSLPRSGGAGTTSLYVTNPEPVRYIDDVVKVRNLAVDNLAGERPDLDQSDPGWRETVVVLGCSLLRIEVWRDDEWVLDDWQPWGPANAAGTDSTS